MKNYKMEKINYGQLVVDKEDDTVKYNDELHKYWIKDTEQACISVTTLIHKFTTFDEAFWSSYKALESIVNLDQFSQVKKELVSTKRFNNTYYERFGISDEEFISAKTSILKEWEEKREVSCVRGNAIHREHELAHLSGQTKELKELGLDRSSFTTDTSNRIKIGKKGVYPELLLSRISPDGKLRLAGQADLIIVDGYDVYVLDYKGLPLDTPILTTKGYKLLESINTNDIIFDKDGNETNIKNISKIHYNPCYEIIFDNGESIIADHEHRWLISFSRGKGKFKDVVLTTEELVEVVDKYNNCKNVYYLPKILNPKPLNISKKILPIDPYILGAWLGDGTSIAGSITTGENTKLWEEIENRGYDIGENISGRTNIQTRTLFGLRTELSKLNLLENKHIPDKYLVSSYNQRLDLLRGFMDADGYYNKKRKRYVMATTRKYQAEYLRDLLATLGIKPSIIFAKKYCDGKTFDGWDVCFTTKENPFLLRNQRGIEYPKTDKASFRNIKSVVKVNMIPTKCIEVSSSSHTFLAGRSLIVTHNTNKKIEKKGFYDRNKRRASTMEYPLNNIEDTNFWHYTLQLSTYAWMIQKIDPKFNIKLLMLIHYDHDGGCTTYECDYLKTDVERMLAYHKKQIENEEFKRNREKIIF